MKSVMQHSFAKVPPPQIERSAFDRNRGYKTTFDAGYLVPVFLDEVLPGDTFNVKMHALCRISTLLRPPMDNIFLDTFFFFVPRRLTWTNWERFNGAQDDPGDSTSFVEPQLPTPVGGFTVGSLGDYFGIPIGKAGVNINSAPFRSYNLIYNDWFRDQNLQNSAVVDRDDGPDVDTDYVVRKRGKRHDYFTSCLPWPQKGTAVSIPLGTSAPIGPDLTTPGSTDVPLWSQPSMANFGLRSAGVTGEPHVYAIKSAGTADTANNARWAQSGLIADLTAATAATINSLRQAFQLQKLYERDARGGTRYTEIVRAHFGVTSPDARLQRPEYLGGGSVAINVHPVAGTNQGNLAAGTTAGTLSAFGTASVNGTGFTKSFTEHGYIIGIVNTRADLTYQQGLHRMWSRRTRFDHYWPALAHIGEQAVLNKEIFLQATAADDNVFGYQERYGEYRYGMSQITGLFRSDAASSLDVWHLSQDFSALPTLGDTFIKEDPPIDRISAVPSEPNFLFDSYFEVKCARPMPLYGVPGQMDRF